MIEAINSTLAVLRELPPAESGWRAILAICQEQYPELPWARLPTPDFATDIADARAWISAELSAMPHVRGIYLGLDTLNMGDEFQESDTDDLEVFNIWIGGSDTCSPEDGSVDWVYERNLTHGNNHLIRGLVALKEAYSREEWEEAFDLCDYVLFLGYSGLVLVHAFTALKFPQAILAAWGFHDGDMYLLGRGTPQAFDLICE